MNLRQAIYPLADALRDALAPARCMGCFQEGTWYCASCRALAPLHTLSCIECKQERPRGTTCIECRQHIPLTGLVSAHAYSTQSIQRGIEWLKFKGVRGVAEILAGILIPKLSAIAPLHELPHTAILVPIPLHKRRLNARGFNQSEDIARAIQRVCSIEVAPLLTRKIATASQAKLPYELRSGAMDNVFVPAVSEQEYIRITRTKPIIILLDDVATTGATLISAAASLPQLEDVELWGAAIARG